MKVHSESKIYEDTASTGRSKFWMIRILADDEGVYLQTEAWQTTTDGTESKHLISTPKQIQGKNVGRSNETDDLRQAEFEMQSVIKKKTDKGYVLLGSKPTKKQTEQPLPMLAQKWDERSKYIHFPAAVQGKLDGYRMVSTGNLTAWTRNGLPQVDACISHIIPVEVTEELLDTLGGKYNPPKAVETDGFILDGELMLPSDVGDFNATASAAKKYDPVMSPQLIYHVFDVIPPKDQADMPFFERIKVAERIVKKANNPSIVLVQTNVVKNEVEFLQSHEKNVLNGFEGTMIRNLDSPYRPKHRSNYLQKFKDFEDDEFTVISWEEGKGNHVGCVVFVCRTNVPCPDPNSCEQDEHVDYNGKVYHTVKAAPKWSLDDRREALRNIKKYMGKLLTIRYQKPLNSDGVPRFPRGIEFRDDL